MADNITINITDNSEEIKHFFQDQFERGLWAIGSTAEGYAKDELYDGHGLDTGRLRSSITFATEKTQDGGEVYIGTNVEYAPYVEFGHHGFGGYHYLKNAATTHSDEYKGLMEDSLKN